VLRDYERGWRAGDAAAVSRLFAPDGMALPNGKPPAVGRDAIARAYESPGGELRLRALAFSVADSVGYIIGGYRYGPGDGDIGKFVLALIRRAGAGWMIAADIDNGNAPPR
jgi:ketosteroid isomerase-like protein